MRIHTLLLGSALGLSVPGAAQQITDTATVANGLVGRMQLQPVRIGNEIWVTSGKLVKTISR